MYSKCICTLLHYVISNTAQHTSGNSSYAIAFTPHIHLVVGVLFLFCLLIIMSSVISYAIPLCGQCLAASCLPLMIPVIETTGVVLHRHWSLVRAMKFAKQFSYTICCTGNSCMTGRRCNGKHVDVKEYFLWQSQHVSFDINTDTGSQFLHITTNATPVIH